MEQKYLSKFFSLCKCQAFKFQFILPQHADNLNKICMAFPGEYYLENNINCTVMQITGKSVKLF